ncbi:MAG: hypothetical protein J6C64_01050 [Lachnospiraceae bacterium]|nr:hypothetical protein [Lachnospiraceae bacterium]
MNKFDKEIIKLAKKSKCPVSIEYYERIDSLLKNLKDKPVGVTKGQTPFSLFRACAAVCSLAAIIMISMPVCAKLGSYVKERMLQMSNEELESYMEASDQNNMTAAHNVEALTYSRELSEEELIRYNDLFEKYENEGLFPEHDLPVVEKIQDSTTTEYPLYETSSYKCYLPERTLTDEELLQMIDFVHKLDYATSQTAEAQEILNNQKEYEANPHPDENDLSEETAIAAASSYLEKILNKDCSSMEKSIEFWFGNGTSGEGYGEYLITFKAGDAESYLVSISRETGILTCVTFILNGKNYAAYQGTSAPADEQLFYSHYETAKAILTGLLDPDISIVESICEYRTDDSGYVENGYIYYIFTLSNGYIYSIGYNMEDDIYPRLYLIDTNGSYGALPDNIILPMEP